jgi:hypothetical protein
MMSGGLGNPQGWNRYSYVNGDPLNFHDPNGLQARATGICYWMPIVGANAKEGFYFTNSQGLICENSPGEGDSEPSWDKIQRQIDQCLREVDRGFVSAKETAHKTIDELLPVDDHRLFVPLNIPTLISAFKAGMNGQAWGKELAGVPGAMTAVFTAAVMVATVNALFRPVIAPVINQVATAMVDLFLAEARVEAINNCYRFI